MFDFAIFLNQTSGILRQKFFYEPSERTIRYGRVSHSYTIESLMTILNNIKLLSCLKIISKPHGEIY